MALVGGVGALARFALDGIVAERAPGEFPFGTLTINLTGAALLGLVTGLAFAADAGLIVATGLLGSYTTFSTWMFETHQLGADNRAFLIALNVIGSLIAGVAAVALGRAIGHAL
jgi:CrcB protein